MLYLGMSLIFECIHLYVMFKLARELYTPNWWRNFIMLSCELGANMGLAEPMFKAFGSLALPREKRKESRKLRCII